MTTEPQNTPLAETKHTELPWTIAQYGDITGAGGEVLLLPGVALPCGSHSRRPEADANREFIVRACNAHDDLVAALSECEAMMRGARAMLLKLEPNIKIEVHDAVAAQAVAALDKANGGAL